MPPKSDILTLYHKKLLPLQEKMRTIYNLYVFPYLKEKLEKPIGEIMEDYKNRNEKEEEIILYYCTKSIY